MMFYSLGIFLGIYYGTGNLAVGAILGFGVHFVTLVFSFRISKFLTQLLTYYKTREIIYQMGIEIFEGLLKTFSIGKELEIDIDSRKSKNLHEVLPEEVDIR